MSRKKTHKSFLKKLAQVPLILLLAASGSLAMARGTAAQENTRPGVTHQAGEIYTQTEKTYSERVEKYEEEQQMLLQGAEKIVFSQDRSTADLLESYPFLSETLNGVNAVRIAESRGAGVNLLFVYKQGHLLPEKTYYCGHDGCALDVYVDDGTGYKQAAGIHYEGTAVHVSRANGLMVFFIEIPRTSYRLGGQNGWFLRGDVFKEKMRPFPPDMPQIERHSNAP